MKRFFLCIGLVFLLSMGATSGWAHDGIIDYTDDFELGYYDIIKHDDQDPWKGALTLTITNTGDEAWGDFHFYSLDSGVTFLEEGGYPNMFYVGGVTPYDAYIDFSEYSIDFYFYSDPVESGETVTFAVYTDNSSHLGTFSIGIEASPVPVPAAAWLFCTGLFGLMGLCRKK